MSNLVDEQRGLAQEVLTKIEMLDPTAIIAGGAPRDWYFGYLARDVDFFIYTRPDLSLAAVKFQLGKILELEQIIAKTGDAIPEIYGKNPDLRIVYDCNYKGLACQIMVMKKPTFKCVVDKFPLNMVKIWYKAGQLHPSVDFIRGVKHKALIKTGVDYNDGDVYIKKIKGYFPDYTYYESYDALAKFLLDKGTA